MATVVLDAEYAGHADSFVKDEVNAAEEQEVSGEADDKENVVDATTFETTFATRLGYDFAKYTVMLSEETDGFMTDLLVALQRHYNTCRGLADLLRTILKQRTQPLKAITTHIRIPALEVLPEPDACIKTRSSCE